MKEKTYKLVNPLTLKELNMLVKTILTIFGISFEKWVIEEMPKSMRTKFKEVK